MSIGGGSVFRIEIRGVVDWPGGGQPLHCRGLISPATVLICQAIRKVKTFLLDLPVQMAVIFP